MRPTAASFPETAGVSLIILAIRKAYDKLPDAVYFLAVIGIQALICIWNAGLAFGVVWVTSFANGPDKNTAQTILSFLTLPL